MKKLIRIIPYIITVSLLFGCGARENKNESENKRRVSLETLKENDPNKSFSIQVTERTQVCEVPENNYSLAIHFEELSSESNDAKLNAILVQYNDSEQAQTKSSLDMAQDPIFHKDAAEEYINKTEIKRADTQVVSLYKTTTMIKDGEVSLVVPYGYSYYYDTGKYIKINHFIPDVYACTDLMAEKLLEEYPDTEFNHIEDGKERNQKEELSELISCTFSPHIIDNPDAPEAFWYIDEDGITFLFSGFQLIQDKTDPIEVHLTFDEIQGINKNAGSIGN